MQFSPQAHSSGTKIGQFGHDRWSSVQALCPEGLEQKTCRLSRLGAVRLKPWFARVGAIARRGQNLPRSRGESRLSKYPRCFAVGSLQHLRVHAATRARCATPATCLHELRHALGEVARVLDRVAPNERGGLEDHHDHVLGLLRIRRRLHLRLELSHNAAPGVDLQDRLVPGADGEGAVLGAGGGLRLHVALHHRRHAPLALHEHGGGVHEPVADLHLLHALAELLLEPGREGLVLLDRVLQFLLLVLGLRQVEAGLVDVHELLALVVNNALAANLVQRVDHVEDFVIQLPHLFHGRRNLGRPLALARDEVNLVLALLHAVDVLLEACLVVPALRGPEPDEALELVLVIKVLHEANLEVLAVAVPEALVLRGLLLPEVVDGVQDLTDHALADDFEGAALLEDLAAHVQGEVLGVNDTPDKSKPPRHQVLELVVDEDALHVEPHGPAALREHVPRQLEGHRARHEEQCAELDLALNLEVRGSHRLVEGLEGGLVKLRIFRSVHHVRVAQPDGLHLVHDLPLEDGPRHALHLRLLALRRRWSRLVHHLVVLDLLVPELDGECDELAVLLEEVRKLPAVQILLGLLL
mmetsp:Transcript_51803/g.144741  ORF Transcript_51803/g.144741 Transcript_51803/m.144741 type:complete len:584 (-) Transcript_51803:908-2659(-)